MISNELLSRYLRDISNLSDKLSTVLDSTPSESDVMEDNEVRDALYFAQEKLAKAKSAIEHFSKPAKEGILKKNSSGKFEVKYKDGTSSYPLSCGSRIEVYLEENIGNAIESGWYASRVEFTDGYYYFYHCGLNHPRLLNGIKARTRINV